MAKYYNLSKDAKTLIFELRDGLQWHDGSAITAEEIQWNIELALKVPNIMPIFKTTFSYLEGAKAFMDGSASNISGIAVSGNKITLSFAQVDPNVLLTFSQWAPLPRKYLEDVDPASWNSSTSQRGTV